MAGEDWGESANLNGDEGQWSLENGGGAIFLREWLDLVRVVHVVDIGGRPLFHSHTIDRRINRKA